MFLFFDYVVLIPPTKSYLTYHPPQFEFSLNLFVFFLSCLAFLAGIFTMSYTVLQLLFSLHIYMTNFFRE